MKEGENYNIIYIVMIIMKKILYVIIIISLIVNVSFKNVIGLEESNLKVSAISAIAINRNNKEVLFEQNAYEILPMASTTKILTGIIAIENANMDDEFTISKNAAFIKGSTVGYKAGETVKVRELLYGLLYRSGNDAAVALAEGISGSVEKFSDLMNHYAIAIGILDSHFITPHGLDSQKHYSSAYDLALLTSRAMQIKEFREIVGSKEISKDKYEFSRDYSNINKILWKIQGANGVKTGYTGQAGKCLVSSINYNDCDIIIVVLNCPDRWNVTEKIFNNVKEIVAFKEGDNKKIV